MKHMNFVIKLIIVALSILSAVAPAQVPPHNPGTICFTSRLWCWASPPGSPGTACVCFTPYGQIPGTRG